MDSLVQDARFALRLLRKFAIRLAIGATPGAVFRLTLAQGIWIAAAGVLGGLALASAAGRILTSTLYDVSATDPLVLISSTAIVAGIATAATVLPARRAARIDPVIALRSE